MSRWVGLCSCGRQYHAATEPTLRKYIREALASGHDVTLWQFSYGLAGAREPLDSDATPPVSADRAMISTAPSEPGSGS